MSRIIIVIVVAVNWRYVFLDENNS